jgi:hypothetical protein
VMLPAAAIVVVDTARFFRAVEWRQSSLEQWLDIINTIVIGRDKRKLWLVVIVQEVRESVYKNIVFIIIGKNKMASILVPQR